MHFCRSVVAFLFLLSISPRYPEAVDTTTKDCLLQCLSKTDPHKALETKILALENQLNTLKNMAGKPSGMVLLDSNGQLHQKYLPAGYDQVSLYDLSWQSLHMAAAAACRGSTATGGSGRSSNYVRVRDQSLGQSCDQICRAHTSTCDGEVSVYGTEGKATSNGEAIGHYYNYSCSHSVNGGGEVSDPKENILKLPLPGKQPYYSYCCCRL